MGFIEHRRSLLVISLGILLLLAACGANASTTTGSSNPGASVTNPPVQQCGTVHTLGLRVVPTDEKGAKDAVDCFWQAYQQCHPATLVYSQGGVDAATVHTFSLKSQNGKCVIIDTIQHVVFPHSSKPAGTDACAGLSQQTDGLHFLGCGNEGEVLVPVVSGKQP